MIEMTPSGPRADVSGPQALGELLGELEEAVKAAGVDTDRWLAPGLSSEEVDAALASVGLRANEELLTWFNWHNGVVPREEGQLGLPILPGIIPSNLQVLVERYRTSVLDFVVPADSGVVLEQRFFTSGIGFGWLPLEADNYTRYAVSCYGPRDAIPLIRVAEPEYFLPAWEGKLQAVSLCTPVTWWLEGITSGAYVWNAELGLWDDPEYFKLPTSQIASGFR